MAGDLLITGVGVLVEPEIDSQLESRLTANQARRLDRLSQIIVAVALGACEQAGVGLPAAETAGATTGATAGGAPGLRVGIVVGTGLGCLERTDSYLEGIVRRGVDHADALTFPDAIDNAPAAQASIALGCRAPSLTVLQREISGECAVILAALMLRRGLADVVIAAAGETRSPRHRAAMRQLRPASPVPGEGAAALVLESVEGARRREARPLGRLVGFAQVAEPSLTPGWRTNLRRASPATVDRAAEAALVMSGVAAAARREIAVIPARTEDDAAGWIMGDGILRCATALELLGRGGHSAAMVAAAARGGMAAALVLAPAHIESPAGGAA